MTPIERVNQIIFDIFEKEGDKFTDDPDDNGGPTRFGVTLVTLDFYFKRHFKRSATVKDVKNLKKSLAFEILLEMFYYDPHIDELPEGIQPLITDMSVNHGPRRAIMLLQEVMKACGMKFGKIDGKCGEKTQFAAGILWAQIGEDFINKLVQRRKEFYREIVEADATQAKWLKGWLNRADSFLV